MEIPVISRPACVDAFTLVLDTAAPRQFIDITGRILDRLTQSGVRDGLVVVASQHTTAAIVVNEHEPLLLEDLDGFLQGLAPQHSDYAHNAVPCLPGEQPNGHAHCQALLLNASAVIPIANGELILGRYQRVFLVELDCARRRRVTVLLLGT